MRGRYAALPTVGSPWGGGAVPEEGGGGHEARPVGRKCRVQGVDSRNQMCALFPYVWGNRPGAMLG